MSNELKRTVLTRDEVWDSIDFDLLKNKFLFTLEISKCGNCDGLGAYINSNANESKGKRVIAYFSRLKGAGLMKSLNIRFEEQTLRTPYNAKIEMAELILKES